MKYSTGDEESKKTSTVEDHDIDLKKAINASFEYLRSNAALESIRRDPYWPKWDSPWWHMLTLFEMGLTHLIPAIAIEQMVSTLKQHYLKIFPIQENELPEGTDPYRNCLPLRFGLHLSSFVSCRS